MGIVDRLLESPEPSIRYKVRGEVLGENSRSGPMIRLQEEVRRSPRVRTLLEARDAAGRITPVNHTYRKFRGAHWVLAHLADLGYPPGDPDLLPLADQVLSFWLRPKHLEETAASDTSVHMDGVPIIDGRARRCASQEGNALWSCLRLGLDDERCDRLARNLMRWQWPDGGWNCDRRPEARHSSFFESLLPLRGLALYAARRGSAEAHAAVLRAAELFLSRNLFRRRRDGAVMHDDFLKLHYPWYWHYDILAALNVIAEAELIEDRRCEEALDLLEAKELPEGGWAAEGKHYRRTDQVSGRVDAVSWGIVSSRRLNEWVTIVALKVLRAAGRRRFASSRLSVTR